MPVVTVRPDRSLDSPVQPTLHLGLRTCIDEAIHRDRSAVALVLACHRSLKQCLIRCDTVYLMKTVDVLGRAQKASRIGKRVVMKVFIRVGERDTWAIPTREWLLLPFR